VFLYALIGENTSLMVSYDVYSARQFFSNLGFGCTD
jgi:hypothetical protein